MTERLRAAVVTTRDRREQYTACVAAVAPQVDLIVTVHHQPPTDTGPEDWQQNPQGLTWLFPVDDPDLISVVAYREEQPNISRMWNLGLQTVHVMAWKLGRRYDVAVLNDDAVVPADWFEKLHVALTMNGWHSQRAAAASMSPGPLSTPLFYTEPAPTNLHHRLTGYAFLLNGDSLVRADEDMRWWLSDCHIDFEARTRGGTVVIPDTGVVHPPNGSPLTAYQAEWWEEDKIKFREKWGCDYA